MARTTVSGLIDTADVRQETLVQKGPAVGLNLDVNGGYVPPAIPATSITLDKTTASLKVSQSLQLNATVLPDDNTEADPTWETSDANIATVGVGGLVVAKAAGSATITVYTEGKTHSAKCVVTVTE